MEPMSIDRRAYAAATDRHNATVMQARKRSPPDFLELSDGRWMAGIYMITRIVRRPSLGVGIYIVRKGIHEIGWRFTLAEAAKFAAEDDATNTKRTTPTESE